MMRVVRRVRVLHGFWLLVDPLSQCWVEPVRGRVLIIALFLIIMQLVSSGDRLTGGIGGSVGNTLHV